MSKFADPQVETRTTPADGRHEYQTSRTIAVPLPSSQDGPSAVVELLASRVSNARLAPGAGTGVALAQSSFGGTVASHAPSESETT